MKRLLFLMLACCLLLSAAACGAKPTPAAEPGQTPASTPEPAPAAEPESEPVKKDWTREELEQLVVQTALGYYYQNPDVQYESIEMVADGTRRESSGEAPEMAAFDSQVYSVCSDYMYGIYYNAFGYKLLGSPRGCQTGKMTAKPVTDPMVVYKYGSDGEADIEKALKEARALLRPGDIIVGTGKSGHAMMFIGDIYGDGHEYLIHCWGGRVDMETGVDRVEPNGAIYIQDVDVNCFQPGGTRGWYLADPARGEIFSILRPMDAEDITLEPTAAAVSRLEHKGITIDRELDRLKYDCILSGEEIPVTLTVTNNGGADYKAVPVTEYVPEGQALTDAGGASVEGNTLRWTADIPAGQSAVFTYKVKITAKLGDTVLFPAGEVADIASRPIPMTVGGKGLTQEQNEKLLHLTAETLPDSIKKADSFLDLDFFNRLYQDVLGVDPKIPATADGFVEGALERKKALGLEVKLLNPKANPDAAYETMLKMVIPGHIMGFYVKVEGSTRDRVMEFREAYYKPGDLFFGLTDANQTRVANENGLDYFVYLGDGKVLAYTAKDGAKISTFAETIELGFKYNLFVGLRPTLAYEDLNSK